METKISALLDGELDAREAREVCAALRHDQALRRVGATYALIGDALREEPHLATEVSAAVLGRLANEPVVLAPGALAAPQRQRESWLRPALAMAATVAGVAVVAWLGLPAPGDKTAQQVAQRDAQQQPPKQLVMATATDVEMREFLIAHQLHSGSIYLNGDTQHVRTVSMTGAK